MSILDRIIQKSRGSVSSSYRDLGSGERIPRPFKLENVLKLSKAIKPLDDVQSEMILSPNAIRQLEIFRNSDDGSCTGSLLWLIDHAKSRPGVANFRDGSRDRCEIARKSRIVYPPLKRSGQ